MTLYKSNEQNLTLDTESLYEKVASQEEVYLESTEEELRTTLISSASDSNTGSCWIAVETQTERETGWSERRRLASPRSTLAPQDTREQERTQAADDLLTGDSDDAPLSEQTVEQMLQEQD